MIAYLNGVLADKSTNEAVIDIQGVGYQVGISTQTFEQLPSTGEKLKLLIYHHFTDSEQRLFGFYSKREKNLFELVITVKNIGPKLGLAILSGLPADQITEAILQQDIGTLSQIPGIGKKTAERMVLELKDKIGELAGSTASAASAGGGKTTGVRQEAISALESLGYNKRSAEKAVTSALKNGFRDGTVTDLVKQALAQLNR